MLQIGDKMPQFQVLDQNGNMVDSRDLLGKKTIIYFYPKDNTSGCTQEACNLRDNYPAMIAKGLSPVQTFALLNLQFINSQFMK